MGLASSRCRSWRKVKTEAWREVNKECWRLFRLLLSSYFPQDGLALTSATGARRARGQCSRAT